MGVRNFEEKYTLFERRERSDFSFLSLNSELESSKNDFFEDIRNERFPDLHEKVGSNR